MYPARSWIVPITIARESSAATGVGGGSSSFAFKVICGDVGVCIVHLSGSFLCDLAVSLRRFFASLLGSPPPVNWFPGGAIDSTHDTDIRRVGRRVGRRLDAP